MFTLAFIHNMGPVGWLIIAIIALLLFGRRLPEVGKSLGKGIVEFKKGLTGIEDEVNSAGRPPAPPAAGLHSAPPAATLPPQRMAPPATAYGADARVSRADVVD